MTLVIYALYVHVYDLYQTSTALNFETDQNKIRKHFAS